MKKILLLTAVAMALLIVAGVFFIDERIFQACLPYLEDAKDENTRLGGALLLVKVFGAADSLLIMILAAGALGYRRAACRVLIGLCLMAGLVLPLKHLVGRTRPDKSENVSFPSGDTGTASVLPTAVGGGTPVTVAMGAVAGGVAFSRIVYQRHYFSDVLAGMAIGLFAGWLAGKLLKYGERRLHWLPPRLWFWAALLLLLLLIAYWAITNAHHRHLVQFLIIYGPAVAVFFAADYCRHNCRSARRNGEISPEAFPAAVADNSSAAASARRNRLGERLYAGLALGAGILCIAIWWVPGFACRLPFFSAGMAVLAFCGLRRKYHFPRYPAAGRSFAFATVGILVIGALGHIYGIL